MRIETLSHRPRGVAVTAVPSQQGETVRTGYRTVFQGEDVWIVGSGENQHIHYSPCTSLAYDS